jgi:glycosyltransferase involved in cell wall biosynthesis
MTAEAVLVDHCCVDLGELHRLDDPGFFTLTLDARTQDHISLTARMRLHVSEPLDALEFLDPSAFADGGGQANSAGSPWLARRAGYETPVPPAKTSNARRFVVSRDQLHTALAGSLCGATAARKGPIEAVAVTCHDPQQIGGGNTILFRLVNWLSRLGVRVTVYSCGRPPTWARVEATFRRFESYDAMCAAIEEPLVLLYAAWHIAPMLRQRKAGQRLVQFHQIIESRHYGHDAASMRADKPVIDLLESLPVERLVVSPHLADAYRRAHGTVSARITNGIDLGVFHPGPRPAAADPRTITVLSVGHPGHFVKGADVLAEALGRLARARAGQRVRWKIAAGSDVSLALPFASSPDVEIELLPNLGATEMREAYWAANVFVNPSLYEGFGLPTIEAMACGTPVVHADNGGLAGLIGHGHDCLIVPPGDADALARAICQTLDRPDAAKMRARHALQTAGRLSLSNQFAEFCEAFRQLLEMPLHADAVAAITSELQAVERRHPGAGIQGSTLGVDVRVQEPALVSVVIPTYNQATYLGQALESLQAQTYPHWEAVVVNDGSTDDTADVIARYAAADRRIRPFSQTNQGISRTLNEGLRHTRGDYFSWLSSDDLYHPQKLQVLLEVLERRDRTYALAHGSFDFLEESSGTITEAPYHRAHLPGTELAEPLKFDFIDGCSMLIRMAAMREAGGFNAEYRHSQDMELWMRLASRGYRFELAPAKVAIRRVHAAQSSSTNMIHCRYDAAALVDFYLDAFPFEDMYAYFDLHAPNDLRQVIRHAVSRTFHTEANVNHPLLQAKYWSWIDKGLAQLPSALRDLALRVALDEWLQHRGLTPRIDFYLERCLDAAQSTIAAPMSSLTQRRDLIGRDIRTTPRATTTFAPRLYQYARELLVDPRTPMFAQELHFHGVSALVGTRHTLAHSAIRYLAQIDHPYRERAAAHAALTAIPRTDTEARALHDALALDGSCGTDLSRQALVPRQRTRRLTKVPVAPDEPTAIGSPEILGTEIQPLSPEAYSITATARRAGGVVSSTRATLRFSEPLRLEYQDPASHERHVIDADALLRHWSEGAHVRLSPDHQLEAPSLSVGFTVLGASAGGGGPRIVWRFAGWLAALGVRVTIYSDDQPPAWALNGVRLVVASDPAVRYGQMADDVVVLYSMLEWPACASALTSVTRQVIHLCQGLEDHNYHDGTIEGLFAPKPLFEALHHVPVPRIVVSPHLQRAFARIGDQDVFLVPNGIDHRVFSPLPGGSAAGRGRRRLLVVGAPERALKGVADVVEAVSILRAEHSEVDWELHVAAGQISGAARELLERDGARVHEAFTPEQMAELYRTVHVVVNAAWYEGFGLPTLEAMACGTAVVQADNRGLDGIAEADVNCLLVPPADPGAIASAVWQLYMDAGLSDRLAARGLETAGRHRMTDQLAAFVPAFEALLQVRFAVVDVDRLRAACEADPLDVRLARWESRHRPLVSVLVPTYNQAQYLPEALASLQAQTYVHWEAIVVDDGSTDQTRAVLADWAGRDSRIKTFSRAHAGVAGTLNEALAHARGEWICWLSSDDLFEPSKLATHIEAARRDPEARAFFTHFRYLDDATGVRHDPDLWQPIPGADMQVSRFLQGNYVHGNSIALHRSVVELLGGFDLRYASGQDHEYWMRVATAVRWSFIDDRTCVTRWHAGQSTHAFPEAGAFDAAIASGEFLNSHCYAGLYPALDLCDEASARRALRDSVTLLLNDAAVVHRCGFSAALLGRLLEWATSATTEPLRHVVAAELAALGDDAWAQSIPDPMRVALRQLCDGGRAEPFRFVPVELPFAAREHAALLRAAGDMREADALDRYATNRWGAPGVRSTSLVSPADFTAAQLRRAAMRSSMSTSTPWSASTNESAFRFDHVRTVYVFGTGKFGMMARELAGRCGWRVAAFLDNNRNLWGTSIDDVPVCQPDVLASQPVDLVLIASHAHRQVLAHQLDGYGLVHGRDYVAFHAPIQVGAVLMKLAV